MIIRFESADIQELSEKYFGDYLTERELEEMEALCTPSNWARVDNGGYEGCLGHLVQAVISIIGLVRGDRRHE